jgi:SAM-dependent MidA family methyltransferase
MGIGTRIGALQREAASPERADALGKAAARLVDAGGMGREYKVMGVTSEVKVKDGEVGWWPFVAGEVQDLPADAKGTLD